MLVRTEIDSVIEKISANSAMVEQRIAFSGRSITNDGLRRPLKTEQEFEKFAFEAGLGYKIRHDNKHAKAGNINTALKSMKSPYVAIFDCDHTPTRSCRVSISERPKSRASDGSAA